MTGIERLRELGNDYIEHAWSAAGKSRGMLIIDIADQIEREQVEAAADHAIVASVVSEMERLLIGQEVRGNNPVARWARELREALGGEGRNPASDVSVSAYDLLPQEDRDAIAWVREHGGISVVKEEWNHSRNLKRSLETTKDKVERQQRHIEHVQGVCKTRVRRIMELNKAIAEMRPRLMPEGMEWPRFEDGEPVRIGDEYECWCGNTHEVNSVTIRKGCSMINATNAHSFVVSDGPFTAHGERVKRPAKVLDADGAEIRKGDTVYFVNGTHPIEVIGVYPEQDSCPVKIKESHAGAICCSGTDPQKLTHRAPVLAADGRPLREGETVWLNEMGLKSKLVDRGEPLKVVAFDKKGNVGVLDRDGIVLGETSPWWFSPSCLTHERPDSWELLEEDAAKNPFDYCKDVGHRLDTCENSEAYKARDLVRRARALADDA